jgi:hypothetical protein
MKGQKVSENETLFLLNEFTEKIKKEKGWFSTQVQFSVDSERAY